VRYICWDISCSPEEKRQVFYWPELAQRKIEEAKEKIRQEAQEKGLTLGPLEVSPWRLDERHPDGEPVKKVWNCQVYGKIL
jgi:hypothetical protein